MPSGPCGGGIWRPRGRSLERFEADPIAGRTLRQGGWTPPGCRQSLPQLDRPACGRDRRLSGRWRESPPAGIVSLPRALAQPLCLRGLALADCRWRDRPLWKRRPFGSSHRPSRVMYPSESARSSPRLQFAGAGRITGWGTYLRQPQPGHEGRFLQGVCAFGSAAAGAAPGMLLRAEPREGAEPRGERVERDDAPAPACLAQRDLRRGPPTPATAWDPPSGTCILRGIPSRRSANGLRNRRRPPRTGPAPRKTSIVPRSVGL